MTLDPTLEHVIRDAAFVFGYHVRNPDQHLRAFRFGRLAEARGVLRDAVNAGLHYSP